MKKVAVRQCHIATFALCVFFYRAPKRCFGEKCIDGTAFRRTAASIKKTSVSK